jgi:hypothetical protein
MDHPEQRQFERYTPPEGAIATLNPFAEFGKINDISEGGMAFECLFFSNDYDADPEIGREREIDIFIPKSGCRPVTLPCRVVRVEDKLLGSYAHSVVPKKRCGVQFMAFERETEVALEAFLAQCQKN